jgi:hypothetical protein
LLLVWILNSELIFGCNNGSRAEKVNLESPTSPTSTG